MRNLVSSHEWLRSSWAIFLYVVIASVFAGFIFTIDGLILWDDPFRYSHSKWLLSHLEPGAVNDNGFVKYYAPLWEFILGFLTEYILFFLNDPTWVRHAFTFALFPICLYVSYLLLRRSGVSKATSLLTIAVLVGCIRLGGHALFNMKDFPGAIFYLVSTLYLWVFLREGHEKGFTYRNLIGLGIVSVLPFLVRSPLIFHFAGLLVFLIAYAAFVTSSLSLRERFRLIIIPLVSGLGFIWLVSPSLWGAPLSEWIAPFTLFGEFPHWVGRIRAFGVTLHSHEMPWWYFFAWIPTIVHPLVLASCIAGLCASLLWRRQVGHPFVINTRFGSYNLSLQRWLWIIVIGTWSAVLFSRPALYDEARHILFLYPIVYVLMILGLDVLKKEVKYTLIVLILWLSLTSYMQWGRYSYTYKSPLIRDRSDDAFLGDYWGLCVGKAYKALKGRVPPGYTVSIDGPVESANIQKRRLASGLLTADEDLGHYIVKGKKHSETTYARISINRDDRNAEALKDVQSGKAKLLWVDTMPPGDRACMLTLYKGS